jgi:H/ACA ribonucleoprotein complex non-core subunit NAF1
VSTSPIFLFSNKIQLGQKTSVIPSDSSSDSDSDSNSESDSDDPGMPPLDGKLQDEECEDEDSGPPATTATYYQTKNELAEMDIAVPAIEEVGSDEVLEKVGEIISVVGNVAVIKGMPIGLASRVSERALDSDTLLVFEDRKVLGYVRILGSRCLC